jgi:hypothetical protein
LRQIFRIHCHLAATLGGALSFVQHSLAKSRPSIVDRGKADENFDRRRTRRVERRVDPRSWMSWTMALARRSCQRSLETRPPMHSSGFCIHATRRKKLGASQANKRSRTKNLFQHRQSVFDQIYGNKKAKNDIIRRMQK